ncbi:ATP-binding protein [Nocardioides seonyuensis]|uniref:ATP-binding protein n=1 Tax=Nocardioides seonyuensis TaxID=2518371 RepID=A0A4V1BMK9_9ACTN|nr:ATP-binding protein [Nocardioides seonyuensis]QBX56732.1 ATP-binding protein [Nocardioides seonyuensis]
MSVVDSRPTGDRALLDRELDHLARLLDGETRDDAMLAEEPGARTPLDTLADVFALTRFERGLVALCLGAEVHEGVGRALLRHGGNVTWSVADRVLPESHWSALAPGSQLRRWQLLDVGPGRLVDAPLSVAEPVLHHLLGIDDLDPWLVPLVHPLRSAALMAGSHGDVTEAVTRCWRDPTAPWQVIGLHGDDEQGRLDVAWLTSVDLGLAPYRLRGSDLPADPAERAHLATVWTRSALLSGASLVIDVDDRTDTGALSALLDRLDGPVVLSSRNAVPITDVVHHEVRRPESAEQRQLWRAVLEGVTDPEVLAEVDLLAATHRLSAREIEQGASLALLDGASAVGGRLRRQLRRGDVDALVRVIEPRARWSDLVLPPDRVELLRAMVDQVRVRCVVHDDWGFADRSSRGLGSTALFAGEPGTGKTMAAEVVAAELDLELLHVDLSAVVSKYIGETEKNLARVFDRADQQGAILLFDEADALFGRRTEVTDSHDRYANIEVSYLLQRMESYRGLAILTTNARAALDKAFVRRLGFIVQFPFPDAMHRRLIWEGAFPDRTPTRDLDHARLASLSLSGGSISNIARAAAFRAASAGGPVTMSDLAWAARAELAKSDRVLAPADLAGWEAGS